MSRRPFKINLKPCPFCGHEVEDFKQPGTEADYYDIRCKTPDCFLEHGADWYFTSRLKLAEIWNTRAIDGQEEG